MSEKKEFNNIPDFSKIGARELPSFTVKADFDGESKEYKGTVLDDGNYAAVIDILRDSDNPLRLKQAAIVLLSSSLENWNQNVAEYLYSFKPVECSRVARIISDKTIEFYHQKSIEAENARKNLPEETETPANT